MSGERPRDLTHHEDRYIEHLRMYLTDLSRRPLEALLAAAEQNLAERPATADWDELLDQLGQPEDYAAELRNDLDLAGPGSVERSRRRRRIRRGIEIGTVAVLVLAAAGGFWRWQTWQAEFTANTSAICVNSDYPDDCDVTGLVDRSNTFGNVREVACEPGTEVTVVNGIVAHSPVTITGIDQGELGGTSTLFRIDDVVPWPMRQGPDGVYDNPEPGSWPLHVGPDSGETLLHFHLTLQCPPGRLSTGGNVTLVQFQVRYHAWGKDRVLWLPFLDALQITGR